MFGSSIDTGQLCASSKIALKLSCLRACGNDIDKADKLYDYVSSGLDLPDFEPVPVSRLQQIKNSADDVLQWVSGHQNEISQIYGIVKSFAGGVKASSVTLPEIPKL